jgi:hypothetical protein
MKKILLIGAGSKWGIFLTNELISRNYEVTLITSSSPQVEANIIKVDYHSLTNDKIKALSRQLGDQQFDLIFFNHNSGGGPDAQYFKPNGPDINSSEWSNGLYVHSMFPAIFLRSITKYITPETKVGWMMTGMIKDAQPENYQWGLYGSAKYINLCVMRLFSQNHPGIFFGVNPSWFPPGEEKINAIEIANLFEKINKDDNGFCLEKNGNRWY